MQRSSRRGFTHVSYIQQVVEDYYSYGGLPDDALQGKDVLEIGPGDTLGVAMLMLARGARTVTCLDRFKPTIDVEKNKAICDHCEHAHQRPANENRRPTAIFYRNESSPDGRIVARYGNAIETIASNADCQQYDLIVSRAVLEHVYDLESAWWSMKYCLRPQCRMLHKVILGIINSFRRSIRCISSLSRLALGATVVP